MPTVISTFGKQNLHCPLPRVIIIFFSTIASISSASSFAQNTFSLVDTSCVITGEEKGIVKPNEGEKSDRECKISGDKLLCGDSSNTQESYNAFFGDGLIVARSASGNLFMLIDMNKKRYSYASAHLAIAKGILMTKQCSGKIK